MSEKVLVPKLRFNGFDEEWIKTNLGNISSNEMYGMNSAAKEYDGFNKYIRITDISETSNKFVPNPLTSPDGELEDKYQLQDGDIVFARTGASTGKTYLYDKNDGNLYFAGFLIKFHIDKAVPKFIFYNTLKEEYLNWISVMSVRSGQPGINSTEYQKLPLYLPSIDEQNKISNFLSKIDEKIELLENKYQYYQDFKKYLMQQIFTQKLRFDECRTVKLGDLCNIQFGRLNANAMVNNGKYRFYTCSKEYYFIDNYVFDTEALIISGNGEHCGYVHYYNGKFNAYQKTYVLNDFSDELDIKYVKYFLEKNIAKTIWRERVSSNTPYITTETVKNIEIIYPPIERQKSIVNVLENCDNKLELYEQQLFEIKKFKNGLLQQMFV